MSFLHISFFEMMIFVRITIVMVILVFVLGEKDKSDWIDPLDMIGLDLSTNKLSNTKDTCEQKLSKLTHDSKEFMDSRSELNNNGPLLTLMKHHIRILMDIWNSAKSTEMPVEEMIAVLKLRPDELEVLNALISSENVTVPMLHDAFHILETMIVEVNPGVVENSVGISDWISDELLRVCNVICIIVWLVYVCLRTLRMRVFTVVIYSLVSAFFVSWFGTWFLLYNNELARNTHNINNADSSCIRDSQKSWMSRILYLDFFDSANEKCLNFHMDVHSNPIWKVSPLLALSSLISSILTQPMSHFGSGLGSFYSNLLANLSWTQMLYVLPTVSILFIVTIMLFCGYSFNTFLFSIAPNGRPRNVTQTVRSENAAPIAAPPPQNIHVHVNLHETKTVPQLDMITRNYSPNSSPKKLTFNPDVKNLTPRKRCLSLGRIPQF